MLVDFCPLMFQYLPPVFSCRNAESEVKRISRSSVDHDDSSAKILKAKSPAEWKVIIEFLFNIELLGFFFQLQNLLIASTIPY